MFVQCTKVSSLQAAQALQPTLTQCRSAGIEFLSLAAA